MFAALEMAQAGIKVVLIERGQPVEQRGRDLGAFFVRGVLNPDSNLCYGKSDFTLLLVACRCELGLTKLNAFKAWLDHNFSMGLTRHAVVVPNLCTAAMAVTLQPA